MISADCDIEKFTSPSVVIAPGLVAATIIACAVFELF
jgi:hypothetical protein